MKSKTILLDAGHGGMINGVYQTAGKRSPEYCGRVLYEGEFNRAIVRRIEELLEIEGIPYVNIAPEAKDISLETRIARANKYPADQSIYVSVHANAGGGRGWEVWTSPGQTESDVIATVVAEEFVKMFRGHNLRKDTTDGDIDKESKFYVLVKTKMPAILTENFFMDNPDECINILTKRRQRDKIAEFHVKAIKRYLSA